MRNILLLITLLTVASPATAQDIHVGSILKSVALDPTTYAPAVVYRAGLRADWDSSRPLFDRGYVELNPDFTASGRVGDVPIGHRAGYAKIDRFAMRLMVDSALHNMASQTLERILIQRHPDKRKLVKVLGIVERVAVGSYLAYASSAKHFRQATRNGQTLAALHR